MFSLLDSFVSLCLCVFAAKSFPSFLRAFRVPPGQIRGAIPRFCKVSLRAVYSGKAQHTCVSESRK